LIRTSTQNLSLEQVCSSDVYGPGQYDRRDKNRNAFYLPQARSLCKVKLTFGGKKILAVEPGPAFDPAEWKHIRGDVKKALLSGASKVGREYSFCTFRATGWWRGTRSGVQIIQPPEDAPRVGLEGADHPFILEFPLKASALQEITNQRRTLLLNVLLRGHTTFQLPRSRHLWATDLDHGFESEWVCRRIAPPLRPSCLMALGKQLSWKRNHYLNLVVRETSFFSAHRFELASRHFRIDGDLGRNLRPPF
jgi:hypothetical protein